MVLRQRVFRVIEQFGQPMCVQRVARKMRASPKLLAQHVGKLHAYGYLTCVRRTVHRESAGNHIIRHYYVPSGKPFHA